MRAFHCVLSCHGDRSLNTVSIGSMVTICSYAFIFHSPLSVAPYISFHVVTGSASQKGRPSIRLRSAADGTAGTNSFTVRVERWPAEVRSEISVVFASVSISARIGIRNWALSGPWPILPRPTNSNIGPIDNLVI